ncbi:DUF1801 domain-containing protein [Flavobacterium sp.]|uniref:DUF1801 domain-containing protein n=1 Tax=Flavobacterium sp. TaxID=239 RepID=UPI003529B139
MKPAEEYILNQPEPYRSILLHVQAVIELNVPEIKLFYKYKIPFYYYNNKPFIYLNASHKKHYVDVAFIRGYELTLHQDQLTGEGRTLVKSLRYKRLEEIDNAVLEELIQAQILLLKK